MNVNVGLLMFNMLYLSGCRREESEDPDFALLTSGLMDRYGSIGLRAFASLLEVEAADPLRRESRGILRFIEATFPTPNVVQD